MTNNLLFLTKTLMSVGDGKMFTRRFFIFIFLIVLYVYEI